MSLCPWKKPERLPKDYLHSKEKHDGVVKKSIGEGVRTTGLKPSHAERTAPWLLEPLKTLTGGSLVAISSYGKRLATADYGIVKVWDTATGQELLTLRATAWGPAVDELGR